MTTPEEPNPDNPTPEPTPEPPPRPGRISVICQECGKKGRLTDQRWVHVTPPEDGHAFVPKTDGTE